jgi:hypothetical protein
MPARAYGGTPGRVVCRHGDGVVVICGTGSRPRQGIVVEVIAPNDGRPVAAANHFERLGVQLTSAP